MGLFGRNKKSGNLFDKNIEPKCEYCENGKPARSQGKILCSRCGIVDGNFSCKKFKYSPFLRIPERGQADTGVSEQSGDVMQDENVQPQETEEMSAETVSENESGDAVFETQPEEEAAPETEMGEEIPAEKAEAQEEQEEQTPDEVSTEDEPEKVILPAYVFAKDDETDEEAKEKKAYENKRAEMTAESKPSGTGERRSYSNINNKPKDNSEKIARLEAVSKPAVSGIKNRVQPKEITLPDVSESVLTPIENKPLKRDSEGYLKTVSVCSVSEIKNTGKTVHRIPPDTKKVTVSDINSK